jgi:pimeloyl-ACP methyl ester carboxylesterase
MHSSICRSSITGSAVIGRRYGAIGDAVLPVHVRFRDYRLSTWFREAGQDLVIFVHGLGASKENWRQASAARELRGKSLLGFDLPGFGDSPRPAGFDYELEKQAGVLAAVIDAYALRRIYLVAHSMGGTIALLLPSRIMSRLESLLLVEPRLRQSSCGIGGEVIQGDYEDFVSNLLPRLRKRAAINPETIFDLDRADPRAFYLSGQSMVRWTRDDQMIRRFRSIPCRKAFIYGQYDKHLEELELIDRQIAYEIENAGHFVMRDNPAAFYRLLGALFDEGA